MLNPLFTLQAEYICRAGKLAGLLGSCYHGWLDMVHKQSVARHCNSLHRFNRRRLSGNANNPDTTPPTVTVRKPAFLPTRETPKLRATWLGHACYYVEFPSGLRVLFDPVFSERCSPFSWLGPKRYTAAPINVGGIDIVDAVIISHNHYDHLDHPTVTAISKKHPQAHFFCPLGNKKWFEDSGISNVTELDWWEEREIRLKPSESKPAVTLPNEGTTQVNKPSPDSVTGLIGCLPCQHVCQLCICFLLSSSKVHGVIFPQQISISLTLLTGNVNGAEFNDTTS